MRSSVVLSVALIAANIVFYTAVQASSPADEPASARTWDGKLGWVDLPAAPATAPAERWSTSIPLGTVGGYELFNVAFVDTMAVTVEADDERVVVAAIDLTTGAQAWSKELDVHGDRADGTPQGVVWDGAGESAVEVVTWRALDDDPQARAASSSRSFVLDSRTGSTLWAGDPHDLGRSFATATADVVVVEGAAFERRTGAELWHREGRVDVSGGHLLAVGNDADGRGFGPLDPTSGQPAWWAPVRWLESIGDRWHVLDGVVLRIAPGDRVDGSDGLNEGDEDDDRDGDGLARFELVPRSSFVEGYDLVTGEPLWQTPLDDAAVEFVTFAFADVWMLDDEVAVVDDRDGSGGFVIDVSTGEIRWEYTGDTTVEHGLDTGGRALLIGADSAGYTVIDGATGDELADLACAYVHLVADGVLCAERHRDLDAASLSVVESITVSLLAFDGSERWRLELGEEVPATAIPGGFAALRDGDGDAFELVGYFE